jgi:hypothetical protein
MKHHEAPNPSAMGQGFLAASACDSSPHEAARRPTDDTRQHARTGRAAPIASCLKPACRREGLIDVSTYPEETEVPSFAKKVVCTKCGARAGTSMCGRIGKSNQLGLA